MSEINMADDVLETEEVPGVGQPSNVPGPDAVGGAAEVVPSETYVQDVSWGGGYVPNQNPLFMRFVALLNNKAAPRADQEFRYCDLGCAEGATVKMLASMFPYAEFVGVDFNAEHIAKANADAEQLGLTNATFHQLDFDDLDATDLGDFDFVSIYGAFSWVASELQNKVMQFAADHLTENGLFLVQYTCSPGKIQMDPLWHLMQEVTKDHEGTSSERATDGIQKLLKFHQRGSMFFQQNPLAAQRLRTLPQENAAQVAHNALSEWQALYHRDVARFAESIGMTFAGQFPIVENLPRLRLPQQFAAIAAGYDDPIVRETVIDFLTNNGLRTDVYAKGELTPEQAEAELDATALVRRPDLNGVSPFRSPSGQEIKWGHPTHRAVITQIGAGGRTIGQLVEELSPAGHDAAAIRTTARMLVAANLVMPSTYVVPPATPVDIDRLVPATSMLSEALAEPFNEGGTDFLPAIYSGHPIPLRPVLRLIISEALSNGREGLEDRVATQLRAVDAGTAPEGYETLEAFVEHQVTRVCDGILPRFAACGLVVGKPGDDDDEAAEPQAEVDIDLSDNDEPADEDAALFGETDDDTSLDASFDPAEPESELLLDVADDSDAEIAEQA